MFKTFVDVMKTQFNTFSFKEWNFAKLILRERLSIKNKRLGENVQFSGSGNSRFTLMYTNEEVFEGL